MREAGLAVASLSLDEDSASEVLERLERRHAIVVAGARLVSAALMRDPGRGG